MFSLAMASSCEKIRKKFGTAFAFPSTKVPNMATFVDCERKALAVPDFLLLRQRLGRNKGKFCGYFNRR